MPELTQEEYDKQMSAKKEELKKLRALAPKTKNKYAVIYEDNDTRIKEAMSAGKIVSKTAFVNEVVAKALNKLQ